MIKILIGLAIIIVLCLILSVILWIIGDVSRKISNLIGNVYTTRESISETMIRGVGTIGILVIFTLLCWFAYTLGDALIN